jgi:outer membrane lipopolysaccharide assembly protein LptE/RlpB
VKRIHFSGFGKMAVVLLLLLISGCGYGFRGGVSNLPADIQSIYIPVFANETTEAGIEVVFANALIYEFTRSRALKLLPEAEAQAYISGKIKSVAVDSVIYANQTQARERRVTVTLDISCLRSDDQKVLWQNPNLSRYEVFQVTGDLNQTERNKQEAIRKLAQDLSERIHNSILENF